MHCGTRFLAPHTPKTGGTTFNRALEIADPGPRVRLTGHTPLHKALHLVEGREVVCTYRHPPHWYCSLWTHAANGNQWTLEALDMWAGIEGRRPIDRELAPAPFEACLAGWLGAPRPLTEKIEMDGVLVRLPRGWVEDYRSSGLGYASWLHRFIYAGADHTVLRTEDITPWCREVLGHDPEIRNTRAVAARRGWLAPAYEEVTDADAWLVEWRGMGWRATSSP